MYDAILLNASLETEYRCKTIDFLWHSKLLEPGEYQIQIIADDDLDLTACRYVTVNTKKEIGIIQKWEYSSTDPGTAIVSGYFLEHLLYESVVYPTYSAYNKTIWQVGSEACATYLDNLGFPLILPSQPSSGVIVPESLSVTMQQTGDYVGDLLYGLAAVCGYGVSLTKANKVMAKNLITNGDFSNGTAGWTTLYGGSLSVSNNTLNVTTGTTNSTIQARQKTTAIFAVGNKMYFKAKIRVKDSSCLKLYVALFGNAGISRIIGNVNLPSANQWYPISGIYTNTGDSGFINTQIVAQYTDIASANGKIMEIQYAACIDLTTTFGAGNEPTAAEMDALLSAYPNSWFDGTQWLPYAGAETRLEVAIANYHDRTGETEDEEVVFSAALNTIKKYDVIKDKSSYRNLAVVAGAGEGSARVFEVVDISASGEQKRHLWVDARDLQQEEDEAITDYRLKLRQRGLEKLAETVEIDNVEIEIEDDEAQKIGTEYDIGDIVWVVINPVQLAYKMKIIEVEDVYNQGKRSTSLIFGNKIPTAWEKVKRFYR